MYIYVLISVCCGLQLPNKDLEERRSTQKVDPVTGVIYTKAIYDPEKPKPKKEVKYSASVSVVTNSHHCVCLLRHHLQYTSTRGLYLIMHRTIELTDYIGPLTLTLVR